MGPSGALSNGRAVDRGTPLSMTASATFSAMDRAESGMGGTLLRAAPNQVAVGVSDPGLGWIEVRAERAGGQITAALTANSAASHAELISILPAMSSYLHDHHPEVQQVYVETGQGTAQNAAGSEQQSNSGQPPHGAAPQPVATISGIGQPARTAQNPNLIAEAAPHQSKLAGHQFSVLA